MAFLFVSCIKVGKVPSDLCGAKTHFNLLKQHRLLLPSLLPDTFEMVSEDEDGKVMFKVNYHYMSQVKNASDTNSAARSRRLAQEAVTLSTSLPLSSSSSVFVRCDEERLDIMKVKYYFSFVLGPAP